MANHAIQKIQQTWRDYRLNRETFKCAFGCTCWDCRIEIELMTETMIHEYAHWDMFRDGQPCYGCDSDTSSAKLVNQTYCVAYLCQDCADKLNLTNTTFTCQRCQQETPCSRAMQDGKDEVAGIICMDCSNNEYDRLLEEQAREEAESLVYFEI